MDLDTSGREKTNLEMDVYRQALSVREEQLLPNNPHSALLVMATHLRLVASCRVPKHVPIYHQDKCEFSWTVVNLSPQQERAHGSDIFIEYHLDSQQCALQGDWSLYCHLSCMWKVRDQRGKKKKFDGQSDEVAQTGFSNGDVHLPFYAKCSLKKPQENRCQLPDKRTVEMETS